MSKFKKDFIDVVNKSIELSKENKPNEPNLFYVGFGNPNSEILIFGKEHTYNKETDKNSLFTENINNAIEWREHIEKDFFQERTATPTQIKTNQPNYNNVFAPYITKKKAGHTWSKYQKLLNSFKEEVNTIDSEFLFDSFITEINTDPSKYSVLTHYENSKRIEFLKSAFFRNFKIKILACGNYLSKENIEDLFELKDYTHEVISVKPRLIVYKDKNQIIVNTRQLSMNVSNDYILQISNLVKNNK